MLNILINGVKRTFELDCGSGLSIITRKMLDNIKNVRVRPTSQKACDYGNNNIQFVGETLLRVSYNGRSVYHVFVIVNDNHAALIGRDLLAKYGTYVVIPSSNETKLVNNVSKQTVLSNFKFFLSEDFETNVQDRVQIEIEPNSKPVFCKTRTIPYRLKELVTTELREMVSRGILTPVQHSKWACPIVPVLKGNGRIRICGDFSLTVNRYNKNVIYPMPTLDEVLSQIGDAKIFSRIDLQNAYLQLPLDDESKKLVVINTIEGLFQFNFLPYGVASASALFQSFLTKILVGISNIIIYQDDILVMNNNDCEHAKTLSSVLGALQAAGLKVNSNKCEFFVNRVQYLGHIFDKDGARPNPEKIKAILQAPRPTCVKELQSFIGLATYYARFIPNYSHVMAPLYSLLKKGVKYIWNKGQETCFNTVKNLFKKDNVLKLFNPKLPTAVECDASMNGIASVLLQLHNNQWLPVQFASRTLQPAQRNYANIDREALSVLFGVEHFSNYLLGGKFVIRTDHRPLLKLYGRGNAIPTTCSARIQRWALRLRRFNYEIEYIKGSVNVQSDALSRLPLAEKADHDEPNELILLLKTVESEIMSSSEIKKATDNDPNLKMLKFLVMTGVPDKLNETLKEYQNIKDEITLINGCLMWNNRVILPTACRKYVLNLLHASHPGIESMKARARSLVYYPKIDSDITDTVKSCIVCNNHARLPPSTKHSSWPKPDKKWSRIHIDHFFFEQKTFFLAVCAKTSYPEVEIVRSVNADDTIKALRKIFSRNGLPDTIVSDNASNFKGETFQCFVTNNAINHITSPARHPSSNGIAEGMVGIIKNLLRKNCEGDLDTRLSQVLLHYRNKPLVSTGISPAQALNSRQYVTLLEKLHPLYHVPKSYTQLNTFNVGDTVYALSVNSKQWFPATISRILGINTFEILCHDSGLTLKRHAHQLRHRRITTDDVTFNDPRIAIQSEPSVPTLQSQSETTVTTPEVVIPEVQSDVENSRTANEPQVDSDMSTNLSSNDEHRQNLRRSTRTRTQTDFFKAGNARYNAF